MTTADKQPRASVDSPQPVALTGDEIDQIWIALSRRILELSVIDRDIEALALACNVTLLPTDEWARLKDEERACRSAREKLNAARGG